MKKIVISFITLMAALLVLIGFCSCGTDKGCSCKCCSTETTTANFEEFISSITIDVPEQSKQPEIPETSFCPNWNEYEKNEIAGRDALGR